MAAVPKDTWNLEFLGLRDLSHSLFTSPYFTTVQSILFAYRYFLHHVESNPPFAKLYMEKAQQRAGTAPSPGRKPLPKSPSRPQGPAHSQSN